MSKIERWEYEKTLSNYFELRIHRRMLLRAMAVAAGAATAGPILSGLGCTPAQPGPTPAATAAPKPTSPPSPTSAPKAEAPKPTAAPATQVPKPAAGGTTSPLSVPEGDPAVETDSVTFPNESATITAYWAKPIGNGPFPALLICHENRGLTDHIRDVARRFAKQGYVGLALDLLSREGGTASIPDQSQVPTILGQIPPERHVSDFQAGFRYLQAQPSVGKNRLGMIGYCFGGGVTWRTVTVIQELKAAAPYYGPAPPLEDVPNIRAAVFGVYAADDPRITVSREPLEAALKEHNKTYQMKTYPGARHAFFNDTGANYNEEQSLVVWKDTLDWFAKYLKS